MLKLAFIYSITKQIYTNNVLLGDTIVLKAPKTETHQKIVLKWQQLKYLSKKWLCQK